MGFIAASRRGLMYIAAGLGAVIGLTRRDVDAVDSRLQSSIDVTKKKIAYESDERRKLFST